MFIESVHVPHHSKLYGQFTNVYVVLKNARDSVKQKKKSVHCVKYVALDQACPVLAFQHINQFAFASHHFN